jgi:LmbE family N-acetylglucosaminyl deacetylase
MNGKLCFFSLIICCLLTGSVRAQNPYPGSSADIFLRLKKLNVLGSVLYVAAHPDDENNGFLPYLAKERLYRTAYLSLTRGDGGQNLIGPEQGIELGMIRTQELLAARRIDGAEQYFSSAYEFGFSKSANEALSIWDKEKVLGDMVWVIRQFQPDIMITRFPGDARAGHGHHWASALLANEAFTAAADPNRFPEQLKKGVTVWQAKRILWNGFNFGGVNTSAGMPLKLDVGGYDPLLGQSAGEIGGEARSMHKSQGEGRPRRKGEIIESFVTTGGDTAHNDIMEGIQTGWSRIEGGKEIGEQLTKIIAAFRFERPDLSVEALVDLYKQLFKLHKTNWVSQKLNELRDIIMDCSGISVEANARDKFILQGDTALISCAVTKRSDIPVKWVYYGSDAAPHFNEEELQTNRLYASDIKQVANEPREANATQPYWLQMPQSKGNFDIENQQLVGKAWNDALMRVGFEFEIYGQRFRVNKPVQYKFVDPVRGELFEPFVMIPHLSFYMNPHVALMNVVQDGKKRSADSIYIKYKSNFTARNIPFSVYLMQDKVKMVFEKQLTDFERGQTTTIALPLKKYYSPDKGNNIEAALRIQLPDGKRLQFTQYFKSIEYDHIPSIYYGFKDRIQFVNEEVKIKGHKIGYINGAGDKVPDALREMGYEVTILEEPDVTELGLKEFDAVIIGIRAPNIYDWLSERNDVLNNYVKSGGNLIAQYIKSNTTASNKRIKLGPYPFSISTGLRVTDETAPVNFLLPDHPVLNYPNKIGANDFDGWIQERSTYQVDQADAHYAMPLGMNDAGEKPGNGSLAIAPYGKGNFAYVSLVLFRQLPAAVPGAFRILANLIALPKNE